MTEERAAEKDRFTQACEDAIAENEFVICAVTSGTQASFPSDAVPYGAGKSTLAFHLAYHLNHFDPVQKRYSDVAIDPDDEAAWATTKRNAWYYPSKILRGIDAASAEGKIIQAGVWDDVQFTAPKKAGLPKALERLVGVLTTERPILRVLIMTFPSMDDISNVVARLIQFELIVNRRGYYEVQQIMKRKNYKNPRKDFIHLGYVSGLDPVGRPPDFDPLPLHMQKWYDAWREEQKRPSRKSAIKELERYENVMPREEQDRLTSSAASALAYTRWGKKDAQMNSIASAILQERHMQKDYESPSLPPKSAEEREADRLKKVEGSKKQDEGRVSERESRQRYPVSDEVISGAIQRHHTAWGIIASADSLIAKKKPTEGEAPANENNVKQG